VKLKQSIVRRVRAQFGRPTGLSGRIVGWIMASRSSNRRRNVWAVSLLDVQRHDRVLEIGFGPGIAIREISRLAVEGYVCGLDHSEEMLRQARRRNAAAIPAGRVDLRLGSVDCLPPFPEPFDKVLAVNAIMFRGQTIDRLEALRRVMRPGGRIAVAHQPRGPSATDATATAKGEEIAAALTQAGFSEVRVRTMSLKPAVVCAIGVNPFLGALRPSGACHS
jgi:ubiquinone/menaquinone biosynthesis C-methylase UbiE